MTVLLPFHVNCLGVKKAFTAVLHCASNLGQEYGWQVCSE